MMKRQMLLLALLAAANANAQVWPISFSQSQGYSQSDRHLDQVGLASGWGDFGVALNQSKMYNSKLDQSLIAKAGETVKPSVAYSGAWMQSYIYVDWNRDGQLSSDNELVSYSAYQTDGTWKNSVGETFQNGNQLNPPTFTIPQDTEEGFYGIRYKIDWNSKAPEGSTESDNDIVTNRGAIADTRLLVRNSGEASLTVSCKHGTVTLHDGTPLTSATLGEGLTLKVNPDDGYRFKSVTLRHGFLTGDSLKGNIPQRARTTITEENNGLVTIPATLVDGDIELTVSFQAGERPAEAYELVFSDEFNQTDSSEPDPAKWAVSQRYKSTWNRFISKDPRVAFVENGKLVCRCMPTPSDRLADDTLEMISGAVETRGLFSFTYGCAEARIKTNPHKGNFPAFWMMPQPPCESWPKAGEIDIWEQIDTENKAYHTVHSNWTYNLGYKQNPQSSFSETVDMAQWHVYAVEWTDEEIKWFVDGKSVANYKKSATQSDIEQGQWPFDAPFYLICNQSVGNGSWASNYEKGHTYETLFDWVRVYQLKPSEPSAIATPTQQKRADLHSAYDLSGRPISSTGSPYRKIVIQGGKKTLIP